MYSVFGWKGLNARQACQLFRSVRDMRRRRLAQLLIHDLDITMKTDKSRLLPPVQSLQGCLNSRPAVIIRSKQMCSTGVQFFSSVLFSIPSQLMMSFACRIKQMVALEPGGHNMGLRGREYTGGTCSKSFSSLLTFRFLTYQRRFEFSVKLKNRATCHFLLRTEIVLC